MITLHKIQKGNQYAIETGKNLRTGLADIRIRLKKQKQKQSYRAISIEHMWYNESKQKAEKSQITKLKSEYRNLK